jgi:serine/threonine protein kinase
MTRTGAVVGTPAFMSPEQIISASVDARSDVFSLGSVLYWMCTGERPFPGDSVSAIAYQVTHREPVHVRELNPALPEEIERVLSRCLSKIPDDRYPTGRELAQDLTGLRG